MSDPHGQHPTAPVAWRLASPPHAPGAVSLIELHGDVSAAFAACGVAPVKPGAVQVRDVLGIDQALVARWSETFATLMPHGGVAVTRLLCEALTSRGIAPSTRRDHPRSRFPEASSMLEARMLDALTRATSPLAIDLLLDQPRRWREAAWSDAESDSAHRDERDRTLQRLIDPPLVAAIGPANVGKSTLVNALARRSVSVVADQPGTTRDHVGVLLELDGLVIRYMDAPGIRDATDAAEAAAIDAALRAASAADLILEVLDAATPFTMPASLASLPRLRVQTRLDLHPGPLAGPAPDIRLTRMQASPDTALPDLSRLIRERLVPSAMLESPQPWRWE
jgi:tRNA modification GTPase